MVNVLIAADFVPNERTARQIDSGDYSCLNGVKSIIQQSDYAILNLECPVVSHEAKPIIKTGPHLHCSERAVECVSQAGFNCVTLANNHFRDYGQVGVEDTLEACNKYKIDYVGGGKNIGAARGVLYKEINGQRIAIINFCENEWSIAGPGYGGSNPLNPVRNYYDIQEARKNSDYVIIIVHGGVELCQYPTPRMVETYRFFIDAGADAVINHHQHCYSGYEEYHGKPIFYGLGNFCFDWAQRGGSLWNEGYIVMLKLGKDCIGYEVIPYTQCREKPSVELMEESKQVTFNERIDDINNTIINPQFLYNKFQEFVGQISSERLLNIEPFSNRYIRALQRRGLLPSFIKGKSLYGWLSRLRCESHIEVLVNILTRKLKDADNQ